MHFVQGYGQVADCPEDGRTGGSIALYKHLSFWDGEIERVGQIAGFPTGMKTGIWTGDYVLKAQGQTGKFEEFRVRWSPLWKRFETKRKAVTKA